MCCSEEEEFIGAAVALWRGGLASDLQPAVIYLKFISILR